MSLADKPARYLGFGAAIGEGISPLVDHDIVRAGYTVTVLFILVRAGMDANDTGNVMKAVDTLIFEMFASAVIPTFIAIHLSRQLYKFLSRFDVDSSIMEYVPVALTLLFTIATADLLDSLVNKGMDMTLRKKVQHPSFRLLCPSFSLLRPVERMAIDDVIRFLNKAVGSINFPKDVGTVPLPARLDPFRTSFRILGHFFAMGEASRFHYTEDVCEILSHVATSYILCHAVYQALNASGGKASVMALFDTLVFDGFASAIIPCTLTFYIIRMTSVFLQEINPIPRLVLRWGPVVSGLAAVVFTYQVIDRCVDQVLDETVRNLY